MLAATSSIQHSKMVDTIVMVKIIPQNVSLHVSDNNLSIVADKILSLKVLQLRDYENIENYNTSTDAMDVFVEYVYMRKSRSYTLHDPLGNLEIHDAKFISEILNYIEFKLGFKHFAD
ncbi:hypothetical protein [Niabella ginsengisoli]|uniref:Uncharacterized protein n=1 Tax=Niabella ginsengisoli TaxID=522298 RepID=A0ABS9SL84_9BACT|nr:hypothetical protein [Niabella ginsengisoli]MCH5599046.1 hypothetical protein [Niabella ginsengisoli]